jgi:apolipoprotein N-acyltransferase
MSYKIGKKWQYRLCNIVVLFYRSVKKTGLCWMRLEIVVSFACYTPVMLLASSIPAVGVLMNPMNCAYVWMIIIGCRKVKRNTWKKRKSAWDFPKRFLSVSFFCSNQLDVFADNLSSLTHQY